jgi:DNA-binding SARP family transcriptional activator
VAAVTNESIARLLDEVFEWGELWIALGQTPEPAYRALMVAHSQLGDRANVRAVYQRCAEALRRELEIEPSEETRDLYERLMSGERQPLTPARGLVG